MNAAARDFHMSTPSATLPPRGPGQDTSAYQFNTSSTGTPASGSSSFLDTVGLTTPPFTGTAAAGGAATVWGSTAPGFPHAPNAPYPLGAGLLTSGTKSELLPRLEAHLKGLGIDVPEFRSDGGKLALGRTIRLNQAVRDALPVLAGGNNLRMDVPLLATESQSFLGKRPHEDLRDVRRVLGGSFESPRRDGTTADDEASGTEGTARPPAPPASYSMPSPSDAQISETLAQRELNTALMLQSIAQWPLLTRAIHAKVNCTQSPSELLSQLHPTALAHAVRAQRGFDRAGRALLAVVENAAPTNLDARTLYSVLTTRGVLDSEAADAIESGELVADFSGLEILSCTVPWHIAEAYFMLKAHRTAPGDDIGHLRAATRSLNFVGANGRLMLNLAQCGLIEVMAAVSNLRARKPGAIVNEAMALFMVALRAAARLQHTFRDRDSGASAGTWEDFCGPLLYVHERRAADDTTRYVPDDLHAIINTIKPLASMFDAQESILGSVLYTLAPEVVLRVGYDDGSSRYASTSTTAVFTTPSSSR